MNFEKEKCVCCGEVFAEGDDIVVCPDCGAPHHRACYAAEGRCACSDKHGEFAWTPENQKTRPVIIPVVRDDRFRSPDMADMGIPPTENLFGISADQAAAFVSSNVTYYIPRFVRIKVTGRGGFNPLCFIYPAGFFASRKMWFWAIMSVLINLVVAVPSLITLLTGLGGESSVLTAEVSSFVYNNRRLIETMSEAANLAYIAICLIFALTANRMYLNFTVRSVKRLKKIHGRRLTRTTLRRAGGISNLNIIAISVLLLISLLFLMGGTIIVLEQIVKMV